MDLNYIRRLAKIFDDSKATQMIIEEEGLKIKFSKNPVNISQHTEISNLTPAIQTLQSPLGIMQNLPSNAPIISPQAVSSGSTIAPILEEKQENIHIISSPIVGTFYSSPSPDDPPFVEVGSHVVKGQTLCIIEAMKLMNDIESDINGTVAKILVQNASPVEFNQALFHIIPD